MSDCIIKDGTGNGWRAGVDEENRLLVQSASHTMQHHEAVHNEQTYQVEGEATLANGTVLPLIIKNDSSDKLLVITYLRVQIIDPAGGTTLPSLGNKFVLQHGLDRAYSSGGTAVTPKNMTLGSTKSSDATCYSGNPTMTGTATVFDSWRPSADGDMNVWNKEGALIIGPRQTLEIAYVGDHTSGTAYARASFVQIDRHAHR